MRTEPRRSAPGSLIKQRHAENLSAAEVLSLCLLCRQIRYTFWLVLVRLLRAPSTGISSPGHAVRCFCGIRCVRCSSLTAPTLYAFYSDIAALVVDVFHVDLLVGRAPRDGLLAVHVPPAGLLAIDSWWMWHSYSGH